MKAWLEGVRTFDGRPAASALARTAPQTRPGGFEQWIVSHKIPVGDAMAVAIDTIKAHGTFLFNGISILIRGTVDGVTTLLRALPATALIVAIAALAVRAAPFVDAHGVRRLGAAVHLESGLLGRDPRDARLGAGRHLGVPPRVGVPLGIAAAHRPRLFAALRPVLDLMQTLPTFVYLIPTLVLFGLGVVPGLISTVIFALPAPIRLTHLGISSVPRH